MTERTDRDRAREWARSLLSQTDVLILDTETTGLDRTDEIVQIAIIATTGQVLLNTLVKPTVPISSKAMSIHHITDEDVATAPTFAALAPTLRELLSGMTVVIYNADFDSRLLEQSAAAHQLTYDVPIFGADGYRCAMEEYAAYVGDWSDWHGNYKWQPLPGGDHTALGDAQATLRLIKRMAGVPNVELTVGVMDRELRGYRDHYAGRGDAYPLPDLLSCFVADLVGAYTERAGSHERQHLAHAYADRWRRDKGWSSGLPNDPGPWSTIRLNDAERGLLAIALQGLAMRQGPPVFQAVTGIARKLGILEQLEGMLRDWIAVSGQQSTTTTAVDTLKQD